jgi:hypothetical protein
MEKKTKKVKRKKSSDGVHAMKLSGKLFLEYKAAMEAFFHAKKELELRELQLQVECSKPEHLPLLRIQNTVKEALKNVAPAQTHYKKVQAKVAEKFGIEQRELYKYTINEYSGAMVFTPPKDDEQQETES